MIAYTPGATRQVDALIRHYEERQRDEAVRALLIALDTAERLIERNPAAGLAAPRPYPRLARRTRAWVKAGRYWISYSIRPRPVIVAVFHDTADIPGRL